MPSETTSLSAEQCRKARIALGLSAIRLASLAGISGETLLRFEKGKPAQVATVQKIYTALTTAGADFAAKSGRRAEGGSKATGQSSFASGPQPLASSRAR